MNTPGFDKEKQVKPKITSDIEGQASLVSSREAARSLLGGLFRNRYIICNDVLGELVRVSVNGAAPRPNPILELLSAPLVNAIFAIWVWFTDEHIIRSFQCKTKIKNV
jgi:hypothetical protein